MAVVGFTLILFLGDMMYIQNAEAQNYAVTVVLYPKNLNKDMVVNQGQSVNFEGQVIEHTPDGGTGLAYAYYRVIDTETSYTISEGQADNSGMFRFTWTAECGNNGRFRNLQAVFLGNSYYGYAESNTLTVEVYGCSPPPPPPKYDTTLSLQIQQGSSSEYIQVYPGLTYGSGYSLSTSQITIYVDGNYEGTVLSNQWYGDIWIGSGSHTIKATFPQLNDANDNSIIYKSSSDTKSYSVQTNTKHETSLSLDITQSSSFEYIQVYPGLTYGSGYSLSTSQITIYVDGNNKGTVSSNQWSGDIWVGSGSHTVKASFPQLNDANDNSIVYKSSSDTKSYRVVGGPAGGGGGPTGGGGGSGISQIDSSLTYAIVGVVVAAVIGIAIGLSKRKKTLAPLQSPYIPPQLTKSDDTQFYGCPTCNGDTQIRYGKQYCPKCKVYL